jgi:hypothetical protein
MSRGLGKMQSSLLTTIRIHGRPMTFEAIRATVRQGADLPADAKLRPSFERSLRRATHSLTQSFHLIAIGDGGPGDPHRYFIHPLMIGMMGDTPTAHTLQKALEADSETEAAAAKSIALMRT